MASPLCAISDVCKGWTSVKNFSHTQDRNAASPPCEISDVWKDWTSVKNIFHTQDTETSYVLEAQHRPAQSEVPQDKRNTMVHLHCVVPDGNLR